MPVLTPFHMYDGLYHRVERCGQRDNSEPRTSCAKWCSSFARAAVRSLEETPSILDEHLGHGLPDCTSVLKTGDISRDVMASNSIKEHHVDPYHDCRCRGVRGLSGLIRRSSARQGDIGSKLLLKICERGSACCSFICDSSGNRPSAGPALGAATRKRQDTAQAPMGSFGAQSTAC